MRDVRGIKKAYYPPFCPRVTVCDCCPLGAPPGAIGAWVPSRSALRCSGSRGRPRPLCSPCGSRRETAPAEAGKESVRGHCGPGSATRCADLRWLQPCWRPERCRDPGVPMFLDPSSQRGTLLMPHSGSCPPKSPAPGGSLLLCRSWAAGAEGSCGVLMDAFSWKQREKIKLPQAAW